jgi:deoxyribodipyrimidine photo-lyase
MPALLWFRRDLRLRDLPPLLTAAAESDGVLACFVLDPRLEASSGSRRMQFLCDSLRQLRDDLDGRLLVTRGRPDERIPVLVKEIDAPSVHVSEDFAPYGRQRDDRVRSALGDVPLVATGSPYLVSPARVTKDDGEPYKVVHPVLRPIARHGMAVSCPIRSQVRELGRSHQAGQARQTGRDTRPGRRTRPAPGRGWRATAVEKVRRQGTRELRRRPESSRPQRHEPDVTHLKFGTIHPRTMVADLDQRRAGARAYLRELAFRDFYAAVLHHWPDSVWWNWNRDFDAIETDTDAKAKRHFESWKAARQDFRSSTPACVNFAKPVSRTTGCG